MLIDCISRRTMGYILQVCLGSAKWRARTNLTQINKACTVDISDSEPDKSGSLPEWSCTNPTPDNFVFHTRYNHIKYELKHFFKPIFDHTYLYLYL